MSIFLCLQIDGPSMLDLQAIMCIVFKTVGDVFDGYVFRPIGHQTIERLLSK